MNPRDHNALEMNQPSLQVIFNYSARNCDIDVSVTVVFFIYSFHQWFKYMDVVKTRFTSIFPYLIYYWIFDISKQNPPYSSAGSKCSSFCILHSLKQQSISFVEHKIDGISIIIDCIRVDTFWCANSARFIRINRLIS